MDNSYWLFHFRIAGETIDNSEKNAHGLGHAFRCLTLINQLKTLYNINSIVVINKTLRGKNFLRERGLEPYSEEHLETLLKQYHVNIIISDINYLEEEFIKTYEKFSPWVCLAPRGQTKYRSSISFKDTLFNDVEPVNRSKNNKIFSGYKYIVTRPEFNEVQKKLFSNSIKKEDNKIIVCMGGEDKQDLTSKILNLLSELDNRWAIEVIIGPLYCNEENLINLISNFDSNISIIRNPENIYLNIAQCSFGIFAAGLISYESIGLGVPCLNINPTDFHAKRSKELENLGVGLDLGEISSLTQAKLMTTIFDLVDNKEKLSAMRVEGESLVDARGAQRIINKIISIE